MRMRDAGFCILHSAFCTSHFQSHRHRAALGRVFEGVVNQVDQGLLEGFAVGGRLRVEG